MHSQGPSTRVITSLLMTSCLCVTMVTSDDVCDKLSSCSCQYDPQHVLDLSPLDSHLTANQPRWLNIPDTQNSGMTHSYNPCTPFSQGTCADVAVCQRGKNSSFSNLGTQNSVIYSDISDEMFLSYSSTDTTNTTRTSMVLLKCTQNSTETIFTALGRDGPGPGKATSLRQSRSTNDHQPTEILYVFQLSSPHCCLRPPAKGNNSDRSRLSEFLMFLCFLTTFRLFEYRTLTT